MPHGTSPLGAFLHRTIVFSSAFCAILVLSVHAMASSAESGNTSSGPVLAAGSNSAGSGGASNLLQSLLADQESRLAQPCSEDKLEIIVEKTLRRLKISVERPWTVTSVEALSCPYLYPFLLREEKQFAAFAIQQSLRLHRQAYLVDQMCNIVSSLQYFAILSLKKTSDLEFFEACFPLLRVLDGQLIYLRTKDAAVSARLSPSSTKAAIAEVRQQTAPSTERAIGRVVQKKSRFERQGV